MSGYDPMEELGRSLESLDESPKRRITVAPPPTDDFTAEVERPSTPVAKETPAVDESPDVDGVELGADRATIVLPARRRGRGLARRSPNGPMKAVTATLPAHLVDRVTELRLDAEVAGHSFKLTELFSASLLELPMKPSAIAAMVDRYSSQFNYGRSARDDGFIEESRLSTQITPDAAQRVATIVRAVYQEYGSKMANKDLYALALLSFLADKN